jgi:hypothetical protein
MKPSVDLKPFIDSLKSNFHSSGVSDAVEMTGKETIFTPRNFNLFSNQFNLFLNLVQLNWLNLLKLL